MAIDFAWALLPLVAQADNRTCDVDATLPALASDFTILLGNSGEIVASLPALEVVFTIEPASALEALTVEIELLPGAVCELAASLEPLSMAMDLGFTLAGQLEALTVEIEVFRGEVESVAATLPALTMELAMRSEGEFDLDCTLQPLQASIPVTSSSRAAVVASLMPLTMQAELFAGRVVNVAITLPLLEVDAQGYSDHVADVAITLPFLTMDGVLSGTESALTTAVVLNTRTKAVTRYDNVPFNSMASYRGIVLAACADGVVALVGDDDDGEPIAAYLRGGVSDFGSERLKRVVSGYFAYRTSGSLYVTLTTDEDESYTYDLEPRQGANLHPTRVKFGRGVQGRFWQWEVGNQDGASFAFRDSNLQVEESIRKV